MFFFLKNIFAELLRDLQYFYGQLLHAFIGQNAPNISNKSKPCLFLLTKDDGEDLAPFFEAERLEGPTLIFLPYEGFLSTKLLDKICAAKAEKAIFTMTHIEMVIPSLDLVVRHLKPAVFVLGASLVPTKRELDLSLFRKVGQNIRQKALEALFVGLRCRQLGQGMDLTVIDYTECLGQKNSALLRRIFTGCRSA